MKKYLSFGCGVNSVAIMLMLLDQKEEFEAIFVDHGTDWPATYGYFAMFQNYLKEHGHKQITVLKPNESGFDNLYDYVYHYRMVPSIRFRFCTSKFKIKVINKYVQKPCFSLIGIDAGESRRAKISSDKGIELRYPLIENEIDRDGCIAIIKDHGLPIPIKSGCYICPYQKAGQWKELRRFYPCLFKKAVDLENRNKEYRVSQGKTPYTLSPSKKSLTTIVDEYQGNLFEQDDYPPCHCGL